MSRILKAPKGAVRKTKRVGRGNGSGLGVTSGKGNNGQNARSGGGVRPGFEGGQMVLYRRVPRRGFSNFPFKKNFKEIDLFSLDKYFQDGDTVSIQTLKEKRLLRKKDNLAKVILKGKTDKKFVFEGISLTKGAKEKLAGSTIKEINNKKEQNKEE